MEQLQTQILEARNKDPKLLQRLCRELRTRIKMKGNVNSEEIRYAQCFADTYLCEAYFKLGNMMNAIKLGLKTVGITMRYRINSLSMDLCDFLGVAYASTEDFENSSIWFLKGLELAKEEKNPEMQSVIYFNIGESYYRLEQYDKAKECFEEGMKLVEQYAPNEDVRKKVKEYYDIHMMKPDIKQGRFEETNERMAKLNSTNYHLEIFLLKAAIALGLNNPNEAENCIAAFLRADQKKYNPFELNLMYHDAFLMSLKMRKEELSERTLKNALYIAEQINLPNTYLRLYDDVITGCNEFGWDDHIEEYFEKYYYWSQQLEDRRNESLLNSLQNQMQIYAIESKEESLQKKVKRLEKGTIFDELTKVYNRSTYTSYFEKMFEESKQGNLYFGVSIIEIDNFDKYNSLVGPEKANQCLIILAKAIKDSFFDKGEVFRMSGAQFTVLTKNVQTLSYLQSLEKLIQDKNIEGVQLPEELPQGMTISIGAINMRPEKGMKAVDYSMMADKLLQISRKDERSKYQYQEQMNF